MVSALLEMSDFGFRITLFLVVGARLTFETTFSSIFFLLRGGTLGGGGSGARVDVRGGGSGASSSSFKVGSTTRIKDGCRRG